VATLESLRSAVLPGARWLVPAAGEAHDLAWVRLMRARVPAFDALEPGDVAIVPLSALAVVAPDAESLGTVVRAVAEAGIAGLVLVEDPRSEGARSAQPLLAAASEARVPVLDAGPGDPAAVERSAIGFLVNHRAELDRQATILEKRLEQIALARGGPEAFAAAIAGFLGRPVAIEGRRGATLAVHAPTDVRGAATAVAKYHERPRTSGVRIPLPLPGETPGGGAAAAAGALVLLGDRPQSELDRAAAGRITGLLALELARDEEVGRAIDTARRETLPGDGPPWVVIVGRQADEVDGGAATADARDALRRDLRALAPARRMTLRGSAQSVEVRVVAAAPPDDPEGLLLARRIGTLLGRVVGVSRPFGDPGGRSAAEADARATMEAAERLSTPPAVAPADRLPAYRLLGNLHNLPEGSRQARALLAPLLHGRADVRREHLATLRAILDQPGLAEAADALGVHRNTVAYRVRRIEEATGWRLSDPELRFPLALALRLVQDEQL
jgi:purine catabolism regulator